MKKKHKLDNYTKEELYSKWIDAMNRRITADEKLDRLKDILSDILELDNY